MSDTRGQLKLDIEEIENTLLGMTLDPRIPVDTRDSIGRMASLAESVGKRLGEELGDADANNETD